MKLKRIPFALSTLALTYMSIFSPVLAQEEKPVKHPIKPFLWKVEGNDLKKPSYLFGTIHLGDPSVSTLHPAAQKAFDQSDAFYAELDMSVKGQLAGAQMILRKDGKTLNESIGEQLSKQLNEELKRIHPQLDSTPFQSMKTWLVSIMPTMLPDQLKGRKALDLQLWEAATAAEKKTSGLEIMEEQIRGFEALTEKEQVLLLKLTLDGLAEDREKNVNQLDELKKIYIQGDSEKIAEFSLKPLREVKVEEHKKLFQKVMGSVLYDRDKIISESISKALKDDGKSSHFFAVGAAHYCFEKSILFYLKEAGYKITRIEE